MTSDPQVPQPYCVRNQDVIIAVMGPTGSGKSNFICKALNLPEGDSVGHSLHSHTRDVTAYALALGEETNLVLVDTPGFDDTAMDDVRTLGLIAEWLKMTYGQGAKLNGLIFLHKIINNRMEGSALRNLSMFRQLCGDDSLKNVILVTTMWDRENTETATLRETELKDEYWRPMINLGSKTGRFDNTEEAAERIIISLMEQPRTVLAIQHELVDNRLELHETAAGAYLERILEAAERRHREATEQLHQEHREALARRDAVAKEVQAELDRMARRLEEAEQARRELLEGRQNDVVASNIRIVAVAAGTAAGSIIGYRAILGLAPLALENPTVQRTGAWLLSLVGGAAARLF